MNIAIIQNESRRTEKPGNRIGIHNHRTVKSVAKALEKNRYAVSIIESDSKVVESLAKFFSGLGKTGQEGMILNLARGIETDSDYSHLQALLEEENIPCLGSLSSAHTFALNGLFLKIILQKNGIPVVDFQTVSPANEDLSRIGYPVRIKPDSEAAAFNLGLIKSPSELRRVIGKNTGQIDLQMLIENSGSDRIFCVGLLGNRQPEPFPVFEFSPQGSPGRPQSFHERRISSGIKFLPASLPSSLTAEMHRIALETFNALNLQDYAQVFLGLDNRNCPVVLEVNSMANLNPTDTFVIAAKVAGYDFDALVNKLVDVAEGRLLSRNDLKPAAASTQKTEYKAGSDLARNIKSFLVGQQENTETLLTHLVNSNTHVESVESINELGKFIIEQFVELGLNYQIFNQKEAGDILFFDNSDSEELDVLFLVNLDNNIPLSRHVYFSRDRYKLYGTGIWSNKGGIAMLLAALQALKAADILSKTRIGFLITTDETWQGRYSRTLVTNIASNSKRVLGLRGGSTDGGIVTSRSGAALYRCELQLKKPNRNEPVLAKTVSLFSHLMASWSDLTDLKKGMVIIPSRVQITTNIAELYTYCEAQLSVRIADSQKMEEVDATIRETMNRIIPLSYQIQLDGGLRRPSMFKSQAVKSLFKQVHQLADTIDLKVFEEHRWSSSDISFIDRQIPKLDGMGPTGLQQRGQDEYIFRGSLLERAVFLALLIAEFGSEEES